MLDAVFTVLTPSRRRALAVGLVVLVVLVLGARRLASAGAAQAPVAAPVVVPAAPVAQRRVLVHVVGAVREPGLYRLDDGDRVADAIEHAGGAAAKADLGGVTRAARVGAGTLFVVRGVGAAGASSGGTTGAAAGPVSLSSATVEELDTLPGIGPVTAEKIVAWRDAHGPFRSVDDLDAVPGIGPTRVEQLRELVTP